MVYWCEESSLISFWAVILTCGVPKISKKNKSQLVKSTNSWASATDSDSVGLEKCFIPDYSGTGGPQTLCTVISSKNKVFQYKGLCNSLFG